MTHVCQLLLITILVLLKNCKCEDSGLKLKVEDVEIDYVNPFYYDENTFDISVNYKPDSHNTINIRVDVINDLPKDLFLKFKLWGRGFGQYNIPTGISMNMNICENKLKDYFFDTIFSNMNWNGNCPPNKGKYECYDFDPEIGMFPISVGLGFRLLLELEVYTPNINIFKSKAYLQVV